MPLDLDGPLDAPLLVVGRDIGQMEVWRANPLAGAAGQLLDTALAKTPLSRAQVVVTNVVCQPPSALGLTRLAPGSWAAAHAPQAIAEGVRKLHARLRARQAHGRSVVLALGEQATLACLGEDPSGSLATYLRAAKGIAIARGYPFTGPFGTVVAALHPSDILHNWHPWWATFCWDVAKAVRYALAGGWHAPSARDVWADAFTPARDGLLGVDIETQRDGTPSCIAFSQSAALGTCVPWNHATLPGIRKALASPAPKVFHNGQFDVTILERQGCTVQAWEHDTMLLWHALEPMLAGKADDDGGAKRRGKQTEKSLRFLVSLLTDEPFYKSYDFTSEEEQWTLCAKDARLTRAIAVTLLARVGLTTTRTA